MRTIETSTRSKLRACVLSIMRLSCLADISFRHSLKSQFPVVRHIQTIPFLAYGAGRSENTASCRFLFILVAQFGEYED